MCCGHDPDQPRSSRYDNDPRVTASGNHFTVTTDGGDTYVVRHSDVFAWVICHDDPHGTFLEVAGGGFAIGIAKADAAIGALIGNPAPAVTR